LWQIKYLALKCHLGCLCLLLFASLPNVLTLFITSCTLRPLCVRVRTASRWHTYIMHVAFDESLDMCM
jgi:hypothetical protein